MTGDDSDRLREARGADGVERVRDIVLGSAGPRDYAAADTTPVEDATVAELLSLTRAEEPADRRRATLALAEREGNDRIRDRLAAMASGDADAEVRQFAVEALAKLDADPGVALDRIEADDDQWVRAEATVALDRLDRAGHEEVFETLVDDSDAPVRRNALISLTRIRGEGTRDRLIEALDDPDDRVREWAVKLLGTHDDDPTIESALASVVNDPDEEDIVRETAARSLGATGQDVESLVEGGGGTEMAGDHVLNGMPDR
ncbi:MAG: HEAT repeat domain-containing protein [Halanaeroarchaeum sp.]